MQIAIGAIPPTGAHACEAILRALPEWFGIEEAIVNYRREIAKNPTIGAFDNDRLIGFLTLKYHNRYSAEIYVMGVLKECHRKGVGGALVERVEEMLRADSIEYLQVKTLAPSKESEEYSRTRRFYESVGFRPLEENKLWGESNPCLIMVKKL
jgi:GNAT superfamily N-acetyltransferase